MTNIYESPLSTRYASDYMLNLFSQDTRYQTWRKLWVSLAKAEMKLGLPIRSEQVLEMEAHIEDIDYECVKKREKEVSAKETKTNNVNTSTYKTNAKPGSLASKANMVSDFNNRKK